MGIEMNKLHLTPSVYHLTKLKNSFFKITIDDSTAIAPHAILYHLTKLKNSFFKITIDDSTAVAPHAICLSFN